MNDDLAQSVALTDQSTVGEARRLARVFASRLPFSEGDVERVAIGVTEAATNVVRHAGKGELVLVPVLHERAPALALLALDRGPGMPDLERCMRDGYSTGGTAGTGLGALKRQAELLEIYAPRGKGTALLAVFRARGVPADDAPVTNPLAEVPFVTGALRLVYPGETECGDEWALARTERGAAILVSDGLGHGPAARQASAEAVRAFEARPDLDPAVVLEHAGIAARHTRGAAVSVAAVDASARTVRYAGLGNVSGMLLTGFGHQGLLGHSGIVGQESRKITSNAYPWPQESVLVMHSDGLGTRWRPEDYPGLLAQHPLLVAGVLVRDHRRARDDVAVVVARWVTAR